MAHLILMKESATGGVPRMWLGPALAISPRRTEEERKNPNVRRTNCRSSPGRTATVPSQLGYVRRKGRRWRRTEFPLLPRKRLSALPAIQRLVHPWCPGAFPPQIQGSNRNCADLQPTIATISQHQGRSRRDCFCLVDRATRQSCGVAA